MAPSEEDSQSFSVNGANGEIYKLRGQDAKERQFWVSRLRREVEFCTNHNFNNREVLKRAVARNMLVCMYMQEADSASSDGRTVSSPRQKSISKRPSSHRVKSHHQKPLSAGSVDRQPTLSEETLTTGLDQFPGGDAMLEVLTRLQRLQDSFYLQLQVY